MCSHACALIQHCGTLLPLLCGGLEFCPLIQWFRVHTIKQIQLTVLSQAGAWGNAEKARKDTASLLIAPGLAIGCKRIFSLVVMWVHPYQVHLVSLVEVAQCLVLLTDEGPDWPYTFIQMNNAILHALLSSKGHPSILMGGKPQRNPCGFLH